MKSIKALPTCLVFLLVGAAGIIFFFFHFGQADARALSDFSTAYRSFDSVMTEYSTAVTSQTGTRDALGQKTQAALTELQAKAAVRISSLTRNDAEIMSLTAGISSLGVQELAALRALRAENGASLQAVSELTRQRKAAYARFLDLTGQKN